ncbi:hypothetical protein ACFWNT_20505 [Streptomyces sp. NPDC058409]|uniref:hypothetical protein n=1 Tax=Streptomyces sp. NPDC058409 TaxID=3346484 RepID=UPI00365934EE
MPAMLISDLTCVRNVRTTGDDERFDLGGQGSVAQTVVRQGSVANGQSSVAEDNRPVSNAQDLCIGLGVAREGRTFPSDRLKVIE